LLEHDFGFIHQVLSFTRVDNDSIIGTVREFHPMLLHYLQAVEQFGPRVFEPEELAKIRAGIRHDYFAYVGRASLVWGRRFWKWQRSGLETIGWKLRVRDVLPAIAAEVLRMAFSPGQSVERLATALRKKTTAGNAAPM